MKSEIWGKMSQGKESIEQMKLHWLWVHVVEPGQLEHKSSLYYFVYF